MREMGKHVRETPHYKNSFDASDARSEEADPSMAISVSLPEVAIKELEKRMHAIEEATGASRIYIDEQLDEFFQKMRGQVAASQTEGTEPKEDTVGPAEDTVTAEGTGTAGISQEQLEMALSDKFAAQQQETEAIQTRLAALEAAPKADPRALHELRENTQKLQKAQDGIPSHLKTLEDKMTRRIDNRVDGIQDEIGKKIARQDYDYGVQQLDHRLTALASRLTHLEQGLGDIGTSIALQISEVDGLKEGAAGMGQGATCLAPLEYGIEELWRCIFKLHAGGVEMRRDRERDDAKLTDLLYHKADVASFDPLKRQLHHMDAEMQLLATHVNESVEEMSKVGEGKADADEMAEQFRTLERELKSVIIQTDLASLSRMRDFEERIANLAQVSTVSIPEHEGKDATGNGIDMASLSGFPIRCLSCNQRTGLPLNRPTPPEKPQDKKGYDGHMYKTRPNLTSEALSKVIVRPRPQTARDRSKGATPAGFPSGRQVNKTTRENHGHLMEPLFLQQPQWPANNSPQPSPRPESAGSQTHRSDGDAVGPLQVTAVPAPPMDSQLEHSNQPSPAAALSKAAVIDMASPESGAGACLPKLGQEPGNRGGRPAG